jgi:hypothetical protein
VARGSWSRWARCSAVLDSDGDSGSQGTGGWERGQCVMCSKILLSLTVSDDGADQRSDGEELHAEHVDGG